MSPVFHPLHQLTVLYGWHPLLCLGYSFTLSQTPLTGSFSPLTPVRETTFLIVLNIFGSVVDLWVTGVSEHCWLTSGGGNTWTCA